MPNTPDPQIDETYAIQNIFGKPPGWLVNWGITSACLFLIVCLSITAFVKYPDKLAMTAKLFSENPPIEIVSTINAQIDSVFVEDKQIISQNEIILTLQSTLNRSHLQDLLLFFKELEEVVFIKDYLNIEFPKGLELGLIGPSYTNMMLQFDEFQHYLRQNGVFEKINALNSEIHQIEKLNHSLGKQEEIERSVLF